MLDRNPRLALLEQLAAVARAIGNAHRLYLLEVLAQGERSVDDLAKAAGLSVANASQHLQVLARVHLVRRRKTGSYVRYALGNDAVLELIRALRTTSELNVAEVDRLLAAFYRAKDSLEPVSRAELWRRVNEGTVAVLDVRPVEEFEAGHIPCAVNIPIAELKKRLAEIPRDHLVVAYCRGPYCLYSFEAVELLRDSGFEAKRLEDGLPEWRMAGLPTEAGPARPCA